MHLLTCSLISCSFDYLLLSKGEPLLCYPVRRLDLLSELPQASTFSGLHCWGVYQGKNISGCHSEYWNHFALYCVSMPWNRNAAALKVIKLKVIILPGFSWLCKLRSMNIHMNWCTAKLTFCSKLSCPPLSLLDNLWDVTDKKRNQTVLTLEWQRNEWSSVNVRVNTQKG